MEKVTKLIRERPLAAFLTHATQDVACGHDESKLGPRHIVVLKVFIVQPPGG
jgi:hypothetical protein